MDCPNPHEAPEGEPIALRCLVRPEIPVGRVRLYYKPAGQELFESVPAPRSRDGWYAAAIPAAAARGKVVHYYFEVRDFSDEVCGQSGHSDSPHIILIRRRGDRALARTPAEARAEENPLEALAATERREQRAAALHRRRPGSFLVGVGAGSGVGWQPGGHRLEFYDDAEIAAGPLPSGILHVSPEIGYQLSAGFALSVQARLQWIHQARPSDPQRRVPARGAVAILGRAQSFFGEGNVQATLSAYAGGGDGFRLTVRPSAQTSRTDTVRGGPFVAGPGAGLIVHLSPHAALTLDARALVGYPRLATVADAGAGVQLSF